MRQKALFEKVRGLLISAVLLSVSWFLTSCFEPAVSTGSETTVNPGALPSGIALYGDSSVAAFATVRIRPEHYLPDTSQKPAGKSAVDELDWVTDLRGYFPLDVLKAGDHVVEISDGNGQGASAHYTASAPDTHVAEDTLRMTLAPTRAVRGVAASRVTLGQKYYIRVHGMERNVTADSGGVFTVPDMPPGRYNLLLSSGSPAIIPVDFEVVVEAGSGAMTIDTVWVD